MSLAFAKLLDLGFTLALAGIERMGAVEKARSMEAAGASADEITDALQKMRQDSEKAAQAKVDAAPDA
jgi:membrane protease subunit (stomatin/prohibitin family)